MKKLLIICFLYPVIIFAQEGVVKEYYPGGAVKSEITYSNNIREGSAKFYFENGKLQEERYYVNGRVHGPVKIYHENGNLKEFYTVDSGKREGAASVYDEQGNFLSEVIFEKGKRVEETPIPEEEFEELETVSEEGGETEFPPAVPETKPVIETVKEELPDDTTYFSVAETAPVPVGGMEGIYKRLYYPQQAKKNNIEGTITVLAYIDQYGEVTKTELLNNLGYGLDEAARTVINYTRFKPAKQDGRVVKYKMEIPIVFKAVPQSDTSK